MAHFIGYVLITWIAFAIATSEALGSTFPQRLKYLLMNLSPLAYLILGVGLYLIGT
jgi:hypothetical protein